jgi:hypothetical protein
MEGPMHKARLTAIATATLASLALAIPAAASANSAGSAHKVTAKIEKRRMDVAKAVKILGQAPGHPGHFSVRLSNGRTVIVPDTFERRVGAAIRHAKLHPDDLTSEKTGTCGSSWITLDTKSDFYPLYRATGFSVAYHGLQMVDFYWTGTISGGPGTGYNPFTYRFAPTNPPAAYRWQNITNSAANYNFGTYTGNVSKLYSWILLSDYDTYCYSEGPSVDGTLP